MHEKEHVPKGTCTKMMANNWYKKTTAHSWVPAKSMCLLLSSWRMQRRLFDSTSCEMKNLAWWSCSQKCYKLFSHIHKQKKTCTRKYKPTSFHHFILKKKSIQEQKCLTLEKYFMVIRNTPHKSSENPTWTVPWKNAANHLVDTYKRQKKKKKTC